MLEIFGNRSVTPARSWMVTLVKRSPTSYNSAYPFTHTPVKNEVPGSDMFCHFSNPQDCKGVFVHGGLTIKPLLSQFIVFRSPATSGIRTLAAMHARFHKMKYYYLIVFFSFCCHYGCVHSPNPGSSLEKVKFSIFPYISEKDGNYYLRYQIDTTDSTNLPLIRVVYTYSSNGKAYYYFSIPISHFERGKIVERPLASDGFEEYAKLNSVYWLNDNKNEVKLKILKEH